MRILFFSLALLLVGCSRSRESVIAGLESSTVLVRDLSGHGTGWVISNNDIVTCYHVAGGTRSIVGLIFSDGDVRYGVVTYASRGLDIAVVHFRNKSVAHVTLTAEFPVKGNPVLWVGYPYDFKLLSSRGMVSGYETEDPAANGIASIMVDGVVVPGYSGSGAVDAEGRIIGMVQARYKDYEGRTPSIGYLIPADRIKWFLDSNEVAYESN